LRGSSLFSAVRAGTSSAHDSQESAQLVAVEPCVPEDAAKCPALQLPVKGDHEKGRAVRVLQANVASPLSNHGPAELFENLDELRAGDDR